MRVLLTITLLAVTSTPLLAQVDSHFWVAPFGFFGAGAVQAFDEQGTIVASFPATPSGVAVKHPNGSVWVATYSPVTSPSITPYTASGPGTPIAVPVPGSAICVDASADIWHASASSILGPTTVTRYDTSGAVIATAVTPLGVLRSITGDAAGNVWALEAFQPRLERIDPAGVTGGPLTIGPDGMHPRTLEIDRRGHMFVFLEPPSGGVGTPLLRKLDVNGALLWSAPVPGGIAMTLDPCGRPVLVVPAGGGFAIQRRSSATGADEGNVAFNFPAGQTPGHIEADAAGRFWILASAGQHLAILDPGGAPHATRILSQPLAGLEGDPGGRHLVTVLDPNADYDADGVANGHEALVGTSPLSATSVPPLLSLVGTPALGAVISIAVSIPTEAGFFYALAASGGTDGVPLPSTAGCRELPLTADAILDFWFTPANFLVHPVVGLLDATGFAAVFATIPPVPALVGVTLYNALVTVDLALPVGVASVTAPLPVVVQ